jgi:hypothetical protein
VIRILHTEEHRSVCILSLALVGGLQCTLHVTFGLVERIQHSVQEPPVPALRLLVPVQVIHLTPLAVEPSEHLVQDGVGEVYCGATQR